MRSRCMHLARSFNPNGIASSSPGLRAASYPGKKIETLSNPERVVAARVIAQCGEPEATTLSGLNPCALYTQGSLPLLRQKHFGGQATLGFVAESLWDSGSLSGAGSALPSVPY
jgi:hypothetical protein